jgi:hypothetical protein
MIGTREPRARPVVLKPYSGHYVPLWRRILVWMILPAIVVFCLPYGFFYALFTPYLLVGFAVPIMVAAGLAIWALPDMRTSPTRSLTVFFYAYTAALILWPNYLAIALPGLPWITLIRLTGFPMVLALLICVSVSEEFRARLAEGLNAVPLIWKGMVLLVVVQLLSIGFSHSPGDSVNKFFVAQVNWTAVFFVSCYVFLKPGRVEQWAALVWAMAIIVGGIGLIEYPHGHVLWSGHIPSFLKIEDETVLRILEGASRDATGQYRISSTFTTALGLAEYMALALPFVLHFMASNYPRIIRLAALVSVPVILWVIIETDARLGMVGFFMSILLYLLFWGVRLWRAQKDSLVGVSIVVAYPAVFCAMVAATFFVGRIRNKVWGGGQYAASNEGRMAQVKAGMPMVFNHPIGHGIGMGGETLGYTNSAGMGTIDSYYLLIGLEYGIVGFVLYFGILLIAIYGAGRAAMFRALPQREYTFLVPLAVSLTNFLVIKSIFSNDDNHPLAFMMMGMAVALLFRMRKDSAAEAVPSASRPALDFTRTAIAARRAG